MTFPTRPGRFAFQSPCRCIFEKVKLGGQLAVLRSLSFFTLGVNMRRPLLYLSRSDRLGWIKTHAEQLDIAFEPLFIEVHPSTGEQMERFHFSPKSILRRVPVFSPLRCWTSSDGLPKR
jgi:hypothetical protein